MQKSIEQQVRRKHGTEKYNKSLSIHHTEVQRTHVYVFVVLNVVYALTFNAKMLRVFKIRTLIAHGLFPYLSVYAHDCWLLHQHLSLSIASYYKFVQSIYIGNGIINACPTYIQFKFEESLWIDIHSLHTLQSAR